MSSPTVCISETCPTTPHMEVMDQCKPCPFFQRDKDCWKKMYTTIQDVWYMMPDGRYLVIRKGFCFDGASIPSYLWWLLGTPMAPDIWAAALIHDFLYHSHLLTKKEADQALYDVLKQFGVALWRRDAILTGVRWFGASSYKRSVLEAVFFTEFGQLVDYSDIATTF